MIRKLSQRQIITQGLSLLNVLKCTSLRATGSRKSSSVTANQISSEKYSKYSPEEGYVRKSQYGKFIPSDLTLEEYVWQDMHKWQNKIATLCITAGRQYTYAQLRDRSGAFAQRLRKQLKLSPLDILAVVLPNLPEYPIVVLGACEAGVTVTSVNPFYTIEEIGRQLLNSRAKVIVTTVAGYTFLKRACTSFKIDIPIICIPTERTDQFPNGAINFFQLSDPQNLDFSQMKRTDATIDDVVFLPYSSGTTGLPKGVMLSHKNITSNCQMMRSFSPFEDLMIEASDTYQEVSPSLLPFFHIYGYSVNLISRLKVGAKIITMSKVTTENLMKSISDHKGTILNLVPPIVHLLTNSPTIKRKHLESLKIVMSGAAPIGASDVERFLTKYPAINFVQGYGMTETSPLILCGHMGCKKYSSVGFVTSGTEIKIINLNDTKEYSGLGPNTNGEILVRGPQIMLGYLNNEEANREIFIERNWLRTGDVGYYDNDGYFYITERIKELIKVKGFQVAPAELEELLRDYPGILEAAVVGVPHETFGEVPRAFVVLRSGQKATEHEIKEFIANKVKDYKRLEGGVTFLNEIPKNVSGKIMRRELKLKYC